MTILTADKGYNWWLLRQRLRAEGVKPVIKYREFGWHDIANNFLQDDTIYHQRSNAESTFFALRRKIRRDRASSNLVRSVPRTRPEMCCQKHRTQRQLLTTVNSRV